MQAEAVAVSTPTKQWKLVVHEHPDTDALLCLWGAAKFVVGDDPYFVTFVRAGETLPAEDAEGFSVLVMDTGGGELDQHGKELERSSSFELFCQHFGLEENQALQPLIELSRASDNVEKIAPTDVHFILKGLPYHYKDKENPTAGWEKACDHAFVLLDILYDQADARETSNREFRKLGDVLEELEGGLKFCFLPYKPHLRDAAFNAGADVVMWTIGKGKNGFYTGVQVNRRSSVNLAPVIEGIRMAEARNRQLDFNGRTDLGLTGEKPEFGAWFLHDSGNLIVCGSRSKELSDFREFPTLNATQIVEIVRKRLPWSSWLKQEK